MNEGMSNEMFENTKGVIRRRKS